ncbi:helix-turn-helix domain-containing protein [Bittarella massiliensis (ex Durand et al. 2017)]|uniref:helix-turn-helix domain-containing protein n=1 Tax=Bittarella massiliensis (ex Durand et al. 2017) TaxID=1720313 RepID=UPI001AA170DD|nr:helix-turn-helix transcriptional regulator [Bittarella massiliensis (ex Durand et al. 2017)]
MKKVLAQRLKQCREEKKLTQQEVAIYCDITEKAYQNYELMMRVPKLEILIRIADLYGVSLDYLVGRTDKKAL